MGPWAQGPRGLILVGATVGWALGPSPWGPAPDLGVALSGLPRIPRVHGSHDGPSHTTRARVTCARARARAPAE